MVLEPRNSKRDQQKKEREKREEKIPKFHPSLKASNALEYLIFLNVSLVLLPINKEIKEERERKKRKWEKEERVRKKREREKVEGMIDKLKREDVSSERCGRGQKRERKEREITIFKLSLNQN